MFLVKAIRSHHFHSFLKLQNPSHHLINPLLLTHLISSNFNRSWNLCSISQRPFSLSAQSLEKIDTELKNPEDFDKKTKKTKKPLDVFFKEAVGIIEKPENDITEMETDTESENGGELKVRLRKLEEEVSVLKQQTKNKNEELKKKGEQDGQVKENKSRLQSLYAFFAKEEGSDIGKSGKFDGLRMENPGVYKELSPDMIMFATHLYKKGYFKDSNFLPKSKFDISCFQNSYARDFIKFAAEQFGKDNQEIAKWLSGSDLKKVALFGCPSLGKKNVFSAKSLRRFFRIPENTVCSKCAIKDSCKFVNQSVWKGDSKNLHLAVVTRVITLYALESVPSQLVVPEEIKLSVSKLLKEVVDLSQTVS